MVDGFDVAPGMAATLGIPEPELRSALGAAGALALQDGAITPQQFWERFRANTGVTAPGELWRDEFKPIRRPAMYALAEEIKVAGLRLVAGTNTVTPHYAMHEQRGDYAVFHHVYASQLMGVSKPDARFWQQILQAEGVPAEQAVFVDDLPENVAAAAALGIHAVQWRTFQQVRSELEELLPGLRQPEPRAVGPTVR